jgi:hypothetical protein
MSETFTLERSGQRDLRITGEKIAVVSSESYDCTRWTVLHLFEVESPRAKYVVHQVNCTKWQGEDTLYQVLLATNEDQLIDLLSSGGEHGDTYLDKLGKELLDQAGIEYVEEL